MDANTDSSPNTVAQTGASTGAEPSAPAFSAPNDPWERAYDAAQAQLQSTPEAPAAPPESVSSPADGSSSPPSTPDEAPAATAGAADDEAPLAIPASGAESDREAPSHWPAEQRDRFAQIPEDARPLVLDFYKGMQKTFTQGMQALKEQEAGIKDLVALREQFSSDPRQTLVRLAREAGLDVWFERPLPEGQMPEFEDMASMAKWVRDDLLRQQQAERTLEAQRAEEEARATRAKLEFEADLKAASAKYPDFATHRDGIMQHIAANPALSVEAAYRLATYDGLTRLAREGLKAKEDLAALKRQHETQRAQATRPGAAGTGSADAATLPSDPWDRAYQQAAARLARVN